ncbi:MAG: hypothetical protein QG578_78 [Thermodesulfobacteriota bacterium]|nr:hypothetical protein [Thermodesulfobacteriota bacterium]
MGLFKRKKIKKRKSGTPIKWFVIISIVVTIIAAILGVKGGMIDYIEDYFKYKDHSYRPVDISHRNEDNKKD